MEETKRRVSRRLEAVVKDAKATQNHEIIYFRKHADIMIQLGVLCAQLQQHKATLDGLIDNNLKLPQKLPENNEQLMKLQEEANERFGLRLSKIDELKNTLEALNKKKSHLEETLETIIENDTKSITDVEKQLDLYKEYLGIEIKLNKKRTIARLRFKDINSTAYLIIPQGNDVISHVKCGSNVAKINNETQTLTHILLIARKLAVLDAKIS